MTAIAPLSTLTFTLDPNSLKRWTVQDYHHMSELGILDFTSFTIQPLQATPAVLSSPHQIKLLPWLFPVSRSRLPLSFLQFNAYYYC
jgi:hypothetical protein